MGRIFFYIITFVLLLMAANAAEAQRFPRPEFEQGHTQPIVQKPSPRADTLEWFDIFVLFASLVVASWLVIKKRSRKGILLLSIFSIAYFGFFREGCICSVGSLQNVALAAFNPGYAIPVSAVLFFILPLLFSLFFGRTFCSGVCPLGAIQDIIALKPLALKPWIEKTLGVIPYIYLGLAVLYAATASDFVICRYDPFIGIYRLDGTFLMFVIGAIMLLIGVFIARPYCRFLCPYGVLLNWTSRFSKTHLTITPSSCIDCKLCEHSCPFGAIDKPTPDDVVLNKPKMVKRYISLVVLIPVLVLIASWMGLRIHENLALVHPKVNLANEILKADANPDMALTLNVESFKSSGQSLEVLNEEAAAIIDQFKTGSWLLGAFIGLIIGLTLASFARYKYRDDYVPNKGTCLSCVRCVDFCPVDKDFDIISNKLS